jgi:DUF4097 and DUF4098 domain-containing protein YvlB
MRVGFALAAAAAMVATVAIGAAPAMAQDSDTRAARALAARARTIARAYQGRDRGPEQTERFSRKVRVGRDGRVSIQNIAGDITVTSGSGDEASIEAVKRTRGDASKLATVHIVVDERGGRVDVRTDHTARNDQVSVDYTVIVPNGAAVDIKSISGTLKVTDVRGAVRAETISGNLITSGTPRLESAKTISGNIDLTAAGADAELTAGSVSGTVRAKGLKVRSLDLGTISGDVVLSDITCDRLAVKSVSGGVEFDGTLARNGRYDVNSHSGSVRLRLGGEIGFELSATTFSGSVRSELPLTIGGDRDVNRRDDRRRGGGMSSRAIHATFGDGSAALTVRTFSGSIVIARR